LEEIYGIAAFRSRQQVLRFEAALRRAGIPASVISTPRDVAIGCGLSVRFDAKYASSVQSVLSAERGDQLIGVYLVRRSGGRSRLTALSR